MKFNNSLRFTISLFVIGFFAASCHNGTIKSNQQLQAADSVSRHGDTVASRIVYYTGQITSHPNDANAYWNRGKLELLNKSLGPALNDLIKAVQLDSTKSGYYYNLADVEFL